MPPILPSSQRSSASEGLPLFWLRAAAMAACVAMLALSVPLIWAAVSASLGLAALAGVALVGVAAFQALPLGLQKLENRILAARQAEAQANPVEQLQNDCLRGEQRLLSFRRALVRIGAKIESMTQMVQERAQQDPGHVLDRQLQAIQRMRHFYECNLVRLNEAQSALEAFRHQVKQKMFEWEFAQAGQVVMSALNPGELEDLVQDLLTDTALRSVQERFNTVFAELDVEMRSIQAPTHGLLDSSTLERFGALHLPTARQRRTT